MPLAFTEHGVLMLRNVLKSNVALNVSIQIIDLFVKLQTEHFNYASLKIDVEALKNAIQKPAQQQKNHDQNLELVFSLIDELADRQNSKAVKKSGMGF